MSSISLFDLLWNYLDQTDIWFELVKHWNSNTSNENISKIVVFIHFNTHDPPWHALFKCQMSFCFCKNMKWHAWAREILVNKCKKLYVKCLVYKCKMSAQLIIAWQLHCFIFREGQSDVMKNSGFTAHLKTWI